MVEDSAIRQQSDLGAVDVAMWYKAYRQDVYRLAYMMTRNPTIAEDICQDVFLTALQKPDAYTAGTNPRAWLLTMARNKALNLLKHEQFTAPMHEDLPDNSNPASGPDVVFLDILKPLNPTQRQIVLFRVAYGLRHKDIARMLDMSPATVRQQYGRALKFLKTQV